MCIPDGVGVVNVRLLSAYLPQSHKSLARITLNGDHIDPQSWYEQVLDHHISLSTLPTLDIAFNQEGTHITISIAFQGKKNCCGTKINVAETDHERDGPAQTDQERDGPAQTEQERDGPAQELCGAQMEGHEPPVGEDLEGQVKLTAADPAEGGFLAGVTACTERLEQADVADEDQWIPTYHAQFAIRRLDSLCGAVWLPLSSDDSELSPRAENLISFGQSCLRRLSTLSTPDGKANDAKWILLCKNRLSTELLLTTKRLRALDVGVILGFVDFRFLPHERANSQEYMRSDPRELRGSDSRGFELPGPGIRSISPDPRIVALASQTLLIPEVLELSPRAARNSEGLDGERAQQVPRVAAGMNLQGDTDWKFESPRKRHLVWLGTHALLEVRQAPVRVKLTKIKFSPTLSHLQYPVKRRESQVRLRGLSAAPTMGLPVPVTAQANASIPPQMHAPSVFPVDIASLRRWMDCHSKLLKVDRGVLMASLVGGSLTPVSADEIKDPKAKEWLEINKVTEGPFGVTRPLGKMERLPSGGGEGLHLERLLLSTRSKWWRDLVLYWPSDSAVFRGRARRHFQRQWTYDSCLQYQTCAICGKDILHFCNGLMFRRIWCIATRSPLQVMQDILRTDTPQTILLSLVHVFLSFDRVLIRIMQAASNLAGISDHCIGECIKAIARHGGLKRAQSSLGLLTVRGIGVSGGKVLAARLRDSLSAWKARHAVLFFITQAACDYNRPLDVDSFDTLSLESGRDRSTAELWLELTIRDALKDLRNPEEYAAALAFLVDLFWHLNSEAVAVSEYARGNSTRGPAAKRGARGKASSVRGDRGSLSCNRGGSSVNRPQQRSEQPYAQSQPTETLARNILQRFLREVEQLEKRLPSGSLSILKVLYAQLELKQYLARATRAVQAQAATFDSADKRTDRLRAALLAQAQGPEGMRDTMTVQELVNAENPIPPDELPQYLAGKGLMSDGRETDSDRGVGFQLLGMTLFSAAQDGEAEAREASVSAQETFLATTLEKMESVSQRPDLWPSIKLMWRSQKAERDCQFPLPTNPTLLFQDIDPQKSYVIRSTKYPLVITCHTTSIYLHRRKLKSDPLTPTADSPSAEGKIMERASDETKPEADLDSSLNRSPNHGQTLAEGDGTASEGNESHLEGNGTPSEGNGTASEGNESRSEGSSTPSQGNGRPSEANGTPSEGNDLPSESAILCPENADETDVGHCGRGAGEWASGYETVVDCNAVVSEVSNDTPGEIASPRQLIMEKRLLFKTHDDLRQDKFIVEILRWMDTRIFREMYGLDLELFRYQVQPMSSQEGFIEFVEHSMPLSTFKKVLKGYLLTDHRRICNFVRTAAAYSVVSYVFGIGDRHTDNLMIDENGCFFHIDYGYLFGSDPKPFPLPPMKLTREMIESLSSDPSLYEAFCAVSTQIFLILRRHMDEIADLIMLVSYSTIPDIERLRIEESSRLSKVLPAFLFPAEEAGESSSPKDEAAVLYPERYREKLTEKLRPELDQAQAIKFFLQDVLNQSVRNTIIPVVMEKLHEWAVYWK